MVEDLAEFKELLWLCKINPKETVCIEKKEIEKIYEYSEIQEYSFLKDYIKDYNSIEKLKFSDSVIIQNLEFFDEPDKIKFEVKSRNISFIVINNSFYEGSKCYLNSKEIRIIRVNGIVQGIIIPVPYIFSYNCI
ncbi:MAG: hypothetical protein NZM44_05795 [Candidatus Calescibacterium sp.]|nr:hypothetical protein [Candidatus Calescibacterium sp.]